MKGKRIKFPFKILIIIAIIAIILYFSIRYLSRSLLTCEYFNIKNIFVNNQEIDLLYLKGNNIFTIDLRRLSLSLSTRYPDYKMIRLIRYLPNCILADFKRRKAVAYVKLYRNFLVDDEGVLFRPERGDPNLVLPVILGLETKIFGPKQGERPNIGELKLALDLIKERDKIKELRDYKIKEIDASSAMSLSFTILENTEVKIGQDIKEKLRIFSSLLPHIRSDFNRIRYIDLRFKEPVIKYK